MQQCLIKILRKPCIVSKKEMKKTGFLKKKKNKKHIDKASTKHLQSFNVKFKNSSLYCVCNVASY